jgi:glycosyltransferase involved in cell wall biosynthesis
MTLPMRVLYLAPNAGLGGAEIVLLTIMRGIRASRPEWSLHLIAGEDGPLLSEASALGVSCQVLEFSPQLKCIGDSPVSGRSGARVARDLAGAAPGIVRYTGRLRNAIARLAPTVIHSNGAKMHVLGSWAHGRVPLVWHLHDYLGPRPMMRRLLRLASRSCAASIAVSKSVSDDVSESCGPGLRVETIYNAVDLERFFPGGAAADLDGLSGLPPAQPGTVRVGLVATFARWKGHRVFLAAASLARASDFGLRYYVIGGPVYRTAGSQYELDELRGMTAELGIRDRVGFAGHLEDTPAALRALDIVVHASTDPEPFGLVLAEAFACGRPIIASGLGGASEVLGSACAAHRFRSGDAGDLAVQIERLAADRDLRARLGSDGRAWAVQRFDSRRLTEEISSVYVSVSNSSRD